nr:lantibiotic dehydratase [Frankia sp. Cr1]
MNASRSAFPRGSPRPAVARSPTTRARSAAPCPRRSPRCGRCRQGRPSRVGVDLRVDCSVTLPPAVIQEAREAVHVLVDVAPRLLGWAAYHSAFSERWGPGAAVPLRDVVGVLGFPAGYRGSSRRDPATFTARDALLARLAQGSALDGRAEVVLDDDLIGRLRGEDDRPPEHHRTPVARGLTLCPAGHTTVAGPHPRVSRSARLRSARLDAAAPPGDR